MSRYRRLFDLRLGGRARVDAEMDLEIEAHIAMRTADLVRAGMAPDAARREAERRFGDFEHARERLHEAARQREAAMRQRDRIGAFILDLRYALRQARRAPGFTALAIGTLALGIGATTTIFTLVERVLLRPLPFPRAAELVMLTGRDSAGNRIQTVSSADWLDWAAAKSLRSTAIHSARFRFGIVAGDTATRVDAVQVSPAFHQTLEARFVAGRPFTMQDVDAGQRVVVVSERLWRAVLGADRALSKPLVTANGAYTVLGVVANGQEFPARVDVWMPFKPRPGSGAARNWINWVAIARLPAVSMLQTASVELSTIARGIHASEPEPIYDFGVGVESLGMAVIGDTGTYLRMLMGAVLVVLLIVCANVAGSGLARATTRKREMAVRTSLGAGRRRLVQQLLVEHVCFAVAAGLLGLGLAIVATRVIVARWGNEIPRADEIGIDGPILLFVFVVSLVAGILAGVLPALRASDVSLASMLSNGSRTSARGGRGIAGASLVSLEIALAVLLSTGAGLLIRSFQTVVRRDIGFDTNVATIEVALSGPRYDRDTVRRYLYWDGLIDAARRVPGVEAVGVSQWIPLAVSGTGFIDIAGRTAPNANAVYRTVSSDFFKALSIPLLVGRTFDATDGRTTDRVVVINRTMAQRYWPGESPIGKQVRARSMEYHYDGSPADWLTVIGIVGDVRTYGLETDVRPEMYVYFRQTPTWTTGMTAVVRSSRPASKMLAELRRAAATVDPQVAVDVGTMDRLLSGTLATRTLAMSLLAAFAGIALILAALGIYGVLSYTVTQRTRELAVRIALGAQHGQLLRMVLWAGGKVVVVGTAIGVAAAFWLTAVLQSMLVGVEAIDPLTFGTAVALLMGVSFAAILIPSLRATRLDPLIALQAE